MGETISEAIGKDHHAFDVYYDNIKATDDAGEKVKWRNQLVWLVARHAISEELTWYPAMEKYLGEEGKRLAATDKEQHHGVEVQLTKIQDMAVTLPEFQPTLDALLAHLHEHVAHERDVDLPRLEAVMPRAESERVAANFQRTKAIAPTHPHLGAPKSSGAAESLAALFAAGTDRFRDLLTRDFPDEVDARRANENVGREQGAEPVAQGEFLNNKF